MSIFTHWGSTKQERDVPFTCDIFIPTHHDSYFRALNINAPAPLVYKWICQMKLAPYSYDHLDNAGHQSPQQLIPGTEKLRKGQKMMTIFHVEHFIPNKEVTIVMDIPPKQWAKYYVPTAITYRILPSPDTKPDHCRLIVKYVADWPETCTGQMERYFVIMADFIMMRQQLLNFRKLAERDYTLTQKNERVVH